MAFDDTLVETSTLRSENITDIRRYLDLFQKEIAESEVTQITTDDYSVESAYFIDQNGQYHQIITEERQLILVAKLSENDDSNYKNMDNDTQIVFPNQHNKTEDIPQVVTLGNEEFETITLIQAHSENPCEIPEVPCVVEQNDTNDETLNVSTKILQDGFDPDDPDVSNVYNFIDREVLNQQKKEIMESSEENDKTNTVRSELKKSPTVTKAHVCNFCNYSTDTKYELLRHLRIHSNELPYKCEICECGFRVNYSLKTHMKTHTGTKPYQCSSCPKDFTASGMRVRHLRYKHTNEKPHKCKICDFASIEIDEMRNHMKYHNSEQPYQCPHCTYSNQKQVNLKRHLIIHTDEKPYKCEICFSTFTQATTLKTHRLIHSGKKPVFKCDHCPATLCRKSDLRIHVEKLHTSYKPIKCNRCGDELPDRYQYKVHIKTHEGEKCFKCALCPYASTAQRRLKSHMLIHTNEKPFPCEFCNQSFKQKQLLRRHHNRIHNPTFKPPTPSEKTHQCNICDRLFTNKGNLLRHISGAHMQGSTENNRNTDIKHRPECTTLNNENELEENTSIPIPTSDTGGIVLGNGVKGDDQQCVMPEMIEIDGQDLQMDSYTSTSIQQVDKSSSPNQKNLILEIESLWDLNDKCDNGIENCFSFDEEIV